MDPWGAINPYALWLLVILISSLSLVGYVAVRWLGSARGAVVTGVAGGLVSSTAVTLSFARQSKLERTRRRPATRSRPASCSRGPSCSSRILVTVAIVHAPLLATLAVPFGAVGAVTAIGAAVCYRRGARSGLRETAPATEVPLKNPFSLLAACKFGLLFAVVLLVVKLAQSYLPEGGLYAVGGASRADRRGRDHALDGALLERRRRRERRPPARSSLAALSNTLVKCGLVVGLGDRALGARVTVATAALAAAGLAAIALT